MPRKAKPKPNSNAKLAAGPAPFAEWLEAEYAAAQAAAQAAPEDVSSVHQRYLTLADVRAAYRRLVAFAPKDGGMDEYDDEHDDRAGDSLDERY